MRLFLRLTLTHTKSDISFHFFPQWKASYCVSYRGRPRTRGPGGEGGYEGGTDLLGADKKDTEFVLELVQLFGVGQMGI